MPKKIHKELVKSAKKAGLKKSTPRFDAYVYGTLNKIEKAKAAKAKRKNKK